jgi:hypothetical protein
MSKHSEQDRAWYANVIATVDCPRCKVKAGKGCLTTGTPQRPIYPPHEGRRDLHPRAGAKVVAAQVSAEAKSSDARRTTLPAMPPARERAKKKVKTELLGSDALFLAHGLRRKLKGDGIGHLVEREIGARDAACGADVDPGVNQYPELQHEVKFVVCVACIEKAKAKKPTKEKRDEQNEAE